MKAHYPRGQRARHLLTEAIRRLGNSDEVDKSRGVKPPQLVGLAACLRAAIDAIGYGIEVDSMDGVAEGLALLLHGELLARQAEVTLAEYGITVRITEGVAK